MSTGAVRTRAGDSLGQLARREEKPHARLRLDESALARLEAGMIFTIEPMINAGRYETKILDDGWTAVTRDKSLSAQCEHSIGITETGYEVFTASLTGLFKPAGL